MVTKPKNIDELLNTCPKNSKIYENIIKAWSIINRDKYKKIVCSISGGSDSDVILDIVWKCDIDNKVEYVWFDTGLEYQATKDHLRYLESKYCVEIKKYKSVKSIPLSCKEYGQPFISKYISEMMYRLQRHDFKWEDKPFEELFVQYPRCKSALQWWCNWHNSQTGKVGMYDIDHKKLLKEFIIQNPPQFKISNKCCEYAKKKIGHKILEEGHYDLQIIGVRKAEGGVRSTAYNNCFDENISGCDNYRPIYWYSNSDKKEYCDHYSIEHSCCYTEYGLRRTGCCGCPFGRNFEQELDIIKNFEPKMYKGICTIFKDSYEYTRAYKQFLKENK